MARENGNSDMRYQGPDDNWYTKEDYERIFQPKSLTCVVPADLAHFSHVQNLDTRDPEIGDWVCCVGVRSRART